ncbi:hypothetical protein RAE19_03130 [Rhodoferax sp. TBRC 17660]|uniref:Uncharacterized protein n=1 Tax=Rhodoferax potami TaxID=3068338 RepID=A0ABU3KIZ6_9BURK|nr:hypothetical protein [Rhodoferax sp. TBRC 17660]MDT7517740.1 hypothetical protein [Rhodoferax sp. TBRC 17660]
MALVERIQAAVARTELLPFKVEIATEAQLDGVIVKRSLDLIQLWNANAAWI